jgi:8-oxo-dGTP pyrophosphatase MutT (NUDIX family)
VPERLRCPVDAYMLLERGSRLLMLRRAPNAAYAPSLLCPPSGHVEPGEDVVAAAVRETAEETGIRLQSGQLRCAVVVHHRSPSGQARLGWFFTAEHGWAGDPVNREPAKHAELIWVDPGVPLRDMVAYTWAGLRAWQSGARFAVHWQEPGSPVHYDPGYEYELTLVPSCPSAVHLRQSARGQFPL